MIRRTDFHFDHTAVRGAVSVVEPLLEQHGQLMITSRPGMQSPLTDDRGWNASTLDPTEFKVLNDEFRGTAIETLLEAVPFRFGRVRLMLMRPKSCLSIHADRGIRYHYAVTTSPDCYLVEINGNQGTFHHIPADGYLYEMDASRYHTAMNTGHCHRIHIVMSAVDVERPTAAEEIGRLHELSGHSREAG